jgi:hypothetical protein
MVARTGVIVFLILLAGCATRPANISDACEIFDEKGGWFNNWHRQSKRVEKEFGVPVPVLMATIHKESAFHARAKPPRTKLLGFIPWKRPSDAYGYAQALKSTWSWYQDETGRHGADRNDFADAVHFVGWYHYQSFKRNGIPRHDAYNLYLAYYLGHGGYERGAYKSNKWVRGAAQRVANKAQQYEIQMRACGLR